MNKPLTNKVLLIGWDAADWKVMTPLLDEGKMPNLKSFLEQGVMGNLATLYPILSPMLWTSIATGKRAYKHGVHGFIEPHAETGTVRPITQLARKTKAIWNILNQSGKKSNIIGWWPTYPVEPINGVMVSNHFQDAPKDFRKKWPLRVGDVHPSELTKSVAEFRIHPTEIEGEQILPFVPKAAEIDQEKDKRLLAVGKILAETATIHGVATATMQLEPWDFMAVYYDAIDHFGHGFMKYHPPQSPWINNEDFEFYKDVIESCYRYHDIMLGSLMQLAGEETTIIICSDHGFHPDRLRPQHIPNEPAGPAEEHRPYGMIAMKGPGIKKDEIVFGANLLDITPTILSLLGLPVGKDMDGKALVTAMTEKPQVEFIDSWDEVEGESAMHPADMRIDAVESQEALQQLIELGYVQELDDDVEKRIAETTRELRYNLARSYLGASRYYEAIPILEELWEDWQDESRFGIKLFDCFLKLNQVDKARETFDKIIERKKEQGAIARDELQKLIEGIKEKEKEAEDKGEDKPEIDEVTQRKVRRLQGKANINLTAIAFLQGNLLFAEKRYDEALQAYENAKSAQTHNLPSLYKHIGEVYAAQKEYQKAEMHYLQVLEYDPFNADGLMGLSEIYLKQGRNFEALDKALATLGLAYHNPKAHFSAGIAQYYLGNINEAIHSLETAIKQNPIFPAAHRWLAIIHTKEKVNLEKANLHRRLSRETRQKIKQWQTGEVEVSETLPQIFDWYERSSSKRQNIISHLDIPLEDSVVIVSGLPRSGTSMMMQMLATGGLPIVTDNVRKADQSNPRGYYEYENVKELDKDNQWLKDHLGEGVKIIAQLLPKIPADVPYRIIFMERHLKEVIASQKKMLTQLNRKGAKLKDVQLARTYLQQLGNVEKMLTNHQNIGVLYLNYEQVINNPVYYASKINHFLGGSLDEEAMIKAVIPKLRHQQIA